MATLKQTKDSIVGSTAQSLERFDRHEQQRQAIFAESHTVRFFIAHLKWDSAEDVKREHDRSLMGKPKIGAY